ncbi:putative exported protein [Labilithrix luteola]|uniref:Putative exported protein n=1 Tax=Labilithrix luteola TaxID=1391654 RepID=A0A0K1PUR9_9BACT|nr:DUF1254 domain-containing protein [Labilithrix luteola]AKU96879.1 putative exported protein [Labilithrix luteola]
MAQQQSDRGRLIDIEARASIFGFPLVLMDVTRAVSTSVPERDEEKQKAPINQLVHLREFPDASFTDVVSPNADTLYSFAFLDLKAEPMVLSLPEMGTRYYLMELMDAWTNVFASPGTRTTGNGKGAFLIAGPTWKGTLPNGVVEIRSPTNLVWIIGRTQTNGKKDYAAVHALQDGYDLRPLSAYGKADFHAPRVAVAPDIDNQTPPIEQVAKMEPTEFFQRLNALMKDNPPSPADADAVKRFGEVGVGPGKVFDRNTVSPEVLATVDLGMTEAIRRIVIEAKRPHGRAQNGWELHEGLGAYGTDYLWRAIVARVGLGANLPEDAIYPHAKVDAEGQPLDGKHRYVMRFAKGALPPVHAFWSISMYDARQFFVDNPIDRYAIGDRDDLVFEPDGSLVLLLQHESPGKEHEPNWLPAPKGSFNLIMRLYWPKAEALDGRWTTPPIERVR